MAIITDRIDNVTKIPAQYLHAKLPAPKSVKIEISPRCNYRCDFCALRTRKVRGFRTGSDRRTLLNLLRSGSFFTRRL